MTAVDQWIRLLICMSISVQLSIFYYRRRCSG